VAGDLTSFGTLFAFVLVCVGIWVLRVKNPDAVRPFKTPLVPLIPILGMLVCSAMILSLGKETCIGCHLDDRWIIHLLPILKEK
jgi:Amino acid transporters